MKKLLSIMLAIVMVMSLMTGCGSTDANSDEQPDTSQQSANSEQTGNAGDAPQEGESEPVEEPEDTTFELAYPESMAAQGYETLVLDEVPSAIACMVTAPVITLYEMGAALTAIPSSSATGEIAAALGLTVLPSLMAEDFDIESVVAVNPDLVIISTSYADSHGKTLEDLGIPVYYTAAGHGVSFEAVKSESMCFIDAFSVDEESSAKGDALKAEFEALEEKCNQLAAEYSDISVLVLQSGGVAMNYVQTSAGTLGSMLNMIGFSNISDATASSSFFALDMETALAEQPDLIVVVGSGTAEDTVALMDEIIAANPTYWNAMTAVTEGQILCLGREYVAVYGIGYIDAVNSLIDDVAAHFAQ